MFSRRDTGTYAAFSHGQGFAVKAAHPAHCELHVSSNTTDPASCSHSSGSAPHNVCLSMQWLGLCSLHAKYSGSSVDSEHVGVARGQGAAVEGHSTGQQDWV